MTKPTGASERTVKAFLLCLWLLQIAVQRGAVAAELPDVEYVMYSDPKFESPPVRIEITSRPLDLWLETLQKPYPKLQRQIVDTIAVAKERGVPGVQRAVDPLVQLLSQSDLDPLLRRSLVKALVTLDAKEHAPLLVEQALRHGRAVSSIVEPALVHWQDASMREDWRRRLSEPSTDAFSLRVAVEGLGAIDDKDSADALRTLVLSQNDPASIRLASASALADLFDQGLVELANELDSSSDGDRFAPLLAVRLLRRHSDAMAVRLLNSLANRDQASVKTAALERLFELDPQNVVTLGESSIDHPDVNVRRIVAKAYFVRPAVELLGPLANLMNDPNPELRQSVAEMLFELAGNEELRDEVLIQATRVLGGDDWRGCEQATRVLVALDHKVSGQRLTELIWHPRGEAMVAAGWGLGVLRMDEHLPAMLARAVDLDQGFRVGKYTPIDQGPTDLQAQLFLAFGQQRFAPSEGLMRKYVIKDFSLGERARAAACWSLGWIRENDPESRLVSSMVARVRDVRGEEPEFEEVRRMCAISLGRMNARSAIKDLREFASPMPGSGRACFWSIEKMTGEPIPPFREGFPLDYTDWFLQPLDSDQQ
ncbi:MAG: hypothetical protein AAF802_13560 [Planctomycetota bacterium]